MKSGGFDLFIPVFQNIQTRRNQKKLTKGRL